MQIAISRKDITPKDDFFPCYMAGHAMRKELAQGIAEPIFVTTYRIENNGNTFIWSVADLIGLDKEMTGCIRREVSEKYDIPKRNIQLGFTHTHSGPLYSYDKLFTEHIAIKGYVEFIEKSIKESIKEVMISDLKDVEAYASVANIQGYYGNRNSINVESDKELIFIEFRDAEDVAIGGIFNITCHPTILGPKNLMISGDLTGYLARKFFSEFNIYPLSTVGAAGDISSRLYRQGNDFKELQRVGDGIFNQFLEQYNPSKINMKFNKCLTYNMKENYLVNHEEIIANITDIEKRIDNAKTFDEKKVYTSALAFAKSKLEIDEYTFELEAYIMDFNEFKYVIMPAELSSEFGVLLKDKLNCSVPMFVGYTNYSVGYLVSADSYGESFESVASLIPKGTTERIIKELSDLIETL